MPYPRPRCLRSGLASGPCVSRSRRRFQQISAAHRAVCDIWLYFIKIRNLNTYDTLYTRHKQRLDLILSVISTESKCVNYLVRAKGLLRLCIHSQRRPIRKPTPTVPSPPGHPTPQRPALPAPHADAPAPPLTGLRCFRKTSI